MGDEKTNESRPLKPCPACKSTERIVRIGTDQPSQIPIMPNITKTTMILPTQIEVLNYVADKYICEGCGITYNDIKQKHVMQGKAQFQTQDGKPLDPTRMG